jgi:hypothetical protein
MPTESQGGGDEKDRAGTSSVKNSAVNVSGLQRPGEQSKMRIQNRIAKLEARLTEQLRPKKRCVPDWLQSELESHGWVFDVSGQLISAVDPLRHTPFEQQPADDEASHR